MDLQQERFTRLQFPVHKIQAKTPTELFNVLPALRRYFQALTKVNLDVVIPHPETNTETKFKTEGYKPSFKGLYPEDLTRIIKYIVFVYDPDSDLIDEYPDDYRLLKDAAAKEAGFIRNHDGSWPQYIQDILEFRNSDVVTWILDYFKVKKNQIWQEIRFIDEELDSLYRRRASKLSRSEVDRQEMDLIKLRLDERENLLKKFYAGHPDLKKASVQDELFPISPENVFKELKIPQEVWAIRQTTDVPKNARIEEARN